MVDCHPVEPGVEVALHLGQEIADESLDVGELGTLVVRNDEAKLVRVVLRTIEKGGSVDVVTGGVVEAAWRALACHAVAYDVFEVRPGCAEIAARYPGIPRLDDD